PLHISVTDEPIFNGLPQSFPVGRYHSWAVAREGFPETLRITAEDEKGVIMALSHNTFDVKGLQFHPESVLTHYGKEMIANWLAQTTDRGALFTDHPAYRQAGIH